MLEGCIAEAGKSFFGRSPAVLSRPICKQPGDSGTGRGPWFPPKWQRASCPARRSGKRILPA